MTSFCLQIKVPLLRDVLKLIAYGEGELNMERTCLERVYPAPNTPSLLCNQRMLPQTSLKSRKIDNNHLCHSLSESDNHIHKNPEVGFSAEHKESNNLSSALDLGRSNKSKRGVFYGLVQQCCYVIDFPKYLLCPISW